MNGTDRCIYSNGVPSGVALIISQIIHGVRELTHTVLSIYFSRHCTKLRLKILIFFDIFPARHSDLDEYNLCPKLWMIIQKTIESL